MNRTNVLQEIRRAFDTTERGIITKSIKVLKERGLVAWMGCTRSESFGQRGDGFHKLLLRRAVPVRGAVPVHRQPPPFLNDDRTKSAGVLAERRARTVRRPFVQVGDGGHTASCWSRLNTIC